MFIIAVFPLIYLGHQMTICTGLVNLAFFLANAMSESITGDSCDEMHWAKSGSKYPISNSCGQNGRDYGSETW